MRKHHAHDQKNFHDINAMIPGSFQDFLRYLNSGSHNKLKILTKKISDYKLLSLSYKNAGNCVPHQ